jgi:CRISPR-associated protein (TIGR03984 family)
MTLVGYAINPISDHECRVLLDWLIRPGPAPDDVGNPRWLLAHCDDGVVWGHRRIPDGSWTLSSAAFPNISPPLRAATLQEFRAFGSDEELLVWRGEGKLHGRRLRDAPSSQPEKMGPIDDLRIILGEHLREEPAGGFTVIADRTGSRHAVPVECRKEDCAHGPPVRLRIRHYLDQDSTGAVRIAATRLVDLKLERP